MSSTKLLTVGLETNVLFALHSIVAPSICLSNCIDKYIICNIRVCNENVTHHAGKKFQVFFVAFDFILFSFLLLQN